MNSEFFDDITMMSKIGMQTANPFNEALDLSVAGNDEDISMDGLEH